MAEQRFTRSGAVYNARTEAPTIDDSCEWDQKLLSFANTTNDDVTNRSGNRFCITNVPTCRDSVMRLDAVGTFIQIKSKI